MPNVAQVGEVVSLIERVAAENGIDDAFFVGGFPRAVAMGLQMSDVHDIDVATTTPNKAIQLAGFVAEAAKSSKYDIYHGSRAVNIEVAGVEVDFQGPTAYDKATPWLHAWGISDSPLAQNIFQRDFTINSLAIPLGSDEIIDLTRRGMADIRNRRVASILPAHEAVPENLTMITRAVRLAAKYRFKIEGTLWDAMRENAPRLEEELSPERIALEAFSLAPHDAGQMLEDLGLERLSSHEIIEMGRQVSEEEEQKK